MKKKQIKVTKTKPEPMANTDLDRLLTSHEAGWYIQVNPSSINKWVKEGKLKAFRTPGGHRRITVGDFIAFLEAYEMPVPQKLRDGVVPPMLKNAA